METIYAITALVLVGLFAGCLGEPQEGAPTTPGGTPPTTPGGGPASPSPEPELKSCSQLSGVQCSSTQNCPGDWLDASDSFSCCSVTCTDSFAPPEEIEPFESPPEDGELGDLT